MKKLNERGEELFLRAFRMWEKKEKTYAEANVMMRVEPNGDFTILTKSQKIKGMMRPIVHEAFRDVYPFSIVVYNRKNMTPLLKAEWSHAVLKVRVSLVKRK